MKCIYENIKNYNGRYLLLEIKPSFVFLIYHIIIKEIKMSKNVFFLEGSPFPEDQGMKYQYRILNEIPKHIKNGDLLILQNLELFILIYMMYSAWIIQG